jgi:decaprenyl-phosphate phosphoribosyltransferase
MATVDELSQPPVKAEVAVTTAGRPLPRALLRAARPKQWAKNVLVFAAPGAAGVLSHGEVLGDTMLALVAFCLAASGTYYLNDVADIEADRRHPTKRLRPIAAGEVPPRLAVLIGVLLLAFGLGVALLVRWELVVVIAVYVGLTLAYTVWLKHVAVLDIAVVASGFIMRAIAGGVATHLPISQWFLIVASFGSLFVVAGKRYGEHREMGDDRGDTRSILALYPLPYLRYVWMIASGVAITAYCLWAFEQSVGRSGLPWFELSIVPFVIALLRYALLLETGHGGAPEDVILGDRTLQVIVVVWAALFASAVYVGK